MICQTIRAIPRFYDAPHPWPGTPCQCIAVTKPLPLVSETPIRV